MEFNYCGQKCQHGSTNNPMTTTLDDFMPHVVLLNENCLSQFNHILNIQQSAGHWTLHGDYTYLRPDSECGTGGLGNAIMSHSNLSFHGFKVLTEGHIQTVSCVTIDDSMSTEACVVHIAPTDNPAHTLLRDQIKDATNFAFGEAAGRPLVFGGDFNREPDHANMDPVYWSGANSTGNFQEVDQCGSVAGTRTGGPPSDDCNHFTKIKDGESTLTRKIDYIFMKRAYFKDFGIQTISTRTFSDHAVMKATMTECSTSSC
jgi:hypothetical protein